MSRQSTRPWVALHLSPRAKGLGLAVLAAALWASAAPRAEAGWGIPYLAPPRVVRRTPPDQSWLMDVPERRGARSRGKVAVFIFKGDDVYEPVRAAVVRVLRRRGLNVTASLRPVDSAAQYREMSYTLNLAVFVEGEMSGEGARQSAHIRLRSGLSGQRIASASFSGQTQKIVGDVGRTLWTRVGPTVTRVCAKASRPRQREGEPTLIDAGTSLDDTPVADRGD